jgi:8-oxo-dGTP pyrophosphatase MutT (NUDIX family)
MSDDAIPAATLIVWRDPDPGEANQPMILVVERSAGMAFAAGAIVFPGGRVDEVDRRLAADIGRSQDAAKVAAVRETIEETGIAPCLEGMVDAAKGRELQDALHAGADFGELLADHSLSLDLDALIPFARWMPAFKQPRKFDTLFFLARAPAGDWQPHPQQGECVAAEWASPSELVARVGRGDAAAIFPTKRNLERLAEHAIFNAAAADARAHQIDTIVPWIEEINGVRHVRIPDGRGYPVTSEPLATAFRA